MVYTFFNGDSSMCFTFKSLRLLKEALIDIKLESIGDKIYREAHPPRGPYAHHNSNKIKLLTGWSEDIAVGVYKGLGYNCDKVGLTMYSYHGAPLDRYMRKFVLISKSGQLCGAPQPSSFKKMMFV